MAEQTILRGEIYIANLYGQDSVQQGEKPVLVVSNDKGNKYSPCILVAPITSKSKTKLPTHMSITLDLPSTILFEQVTTISKSQLGRKIGSMKISRLEELNRKLSISLGLDDKYNELQEAK